MARLVRLRKKVVIPGCGLFVFLAISFGPILLTAWGHLIHGNYIECAGKSFHVPLWWCAKIAGRKLYISKFSSTVFSKTPANGLISLWPVESPPKTEAQKELAYQSFTTVYWTYLAGGVGEATGPVRKGIGESEAVCMVTSAVKQEWISVSCLVEGWSNRRYDGRRRSGCARGCGPDAARRVT